MGIEDNGFEKPSKKQNQKTPIWENGYYKKKLQRLEEGVDFFGEQPEIIDEIKKTKEKIAKLSEDVKNANN